MMVFVVAPIIAVTALVLFFVWSRISAPELISQRILRIDGWEYHYRVQGEGEPLLLVHGIGASSHSWHSLEPLLAKHFKVVSIDLPGFGASSKIVNEKYGLDEQAARLRAFLDELRIGRCALIGHSMGGNLVLWLGHLWPERFADIVAIAPAASPKLIPAVFPRLAAFSKPASWLFVKPIATLFHRHSRGFPEMVTEERVLQSVRIYHRQPDAIRTFFSASAAISDSRLSDTIFSGRILVLWGERDRLVRRWVIDRLMPRLPEGRLAVHPRAGHELFEDDPQWTYDQIMTFLKERV